MSQAMRRYDREVTDFDEIVAILRQCPVIRLGLLDEQGVYIVPMNYGLRAENNHLTLYFHGAGSGRKIAALKNHPEICFEADHNLKIDEGEIWCSTTTEYESVIGYGVASLITEPAEKKMAMDEVLKFYDFEGDFKYNESIFRVVNVYKIEVSELRGKRNPIMKHGHHTSSV